MTTPEDIDYAFGKGTFALFAKAYPNTSEHLIVQLWLSSPVDAKFRYADKAHALREDYWRLVDEQTGQVEGPFIKCTGYDAPLHPYLKGK